VPARIPPSDELNQPERPVPDWGPLVARVRAGDQAALGAIFRAFVLPLSAFAYRSVQSRDTAAELVQDVFYRIWRGHARWEVEGSLKAYLYRATRNRVLDFLRHEKIERRWAERSVREHADEVARSHAPEDEAMETRDRVAALERALDNLPERRRLVFVLRWRDGLSHQEIADRMGVTVKTVENQLTRAIQALRERLGPPAP
jgi:RNA polymerase sigma-70 factor (ECF subfamily)